MNKKVKLFFRDARIFATIDNDVYNFRNKDGVLEYSEAVPTLSNEYWKIFQINGMTDENQFLIITRNVGRPKMVNVKYWFKEGILNPKIVLVENDIAIKNFYSPSSEEYVNGITSQWKLLTYHGFYENILPKLVTGHIVDLEFTGNILRLFVDNGKFLENHYFHKIGQQYYKINQQWANQQMIVGKSQNETAPTSTKWKNLCEDDAALFIELRRILKI